jgi:hypothetical protein
VQPWSSIVALALGLNDDAITITGLTRTDNFLRRVFKNRSFAEMIDQSPLKALSSGLGVL